MIKADFAARIAVEEEAVGMIVQLKRQHRERIVDAGPNMRGVEYFLQRPRNTCFSGGGAPV